MTQTKAGQILSSLLEEKGVVPQDGTDIRHLLALTLSTGDLPDDLSRALAETFDAVAEATQTTASDTDDAANSDGTSSNA